MAHEDKKPIEFIKSWSSEFEAVSNRVRQLIGNSHWLSDGKHKEAVLLNFLSKYTFHSYIYSCGFIVSHEKGVASSGEIDIIVASKETGIPWFYESGILITPPENVLAHIHVKSSYSKGAMKDIFKSVERANSAISKGGSALGALDSKWAGGFFFSQDNKPELGLLKKHLSEFIQEVSEPRLLPNAIFIHPDISIILTLNNSTVSTKIINAPALSIALFLQCFYEGINQSTLVEIGDLLFSQSPEQIVDFNIQFSGE